MAVYKSGFCDNGFHEGAAPKNYQGKPLPTCSLVGVCQCPCHETFDKLFKVSDMPRIAVDNSGYVPDKGDYVMPSWRELAEERVARDEQTVEILPSEAPELVPALTVRKFTESPSGRAARGQLEHLVNAVCAAWVVDQDPGVPICTPQYVSMEIARAEGIKPPSTGAITAVFDRWLAMGYADIQRKPVRFVAYTDRGRELGLDRCIAEARLAKRRGR